MLKNVKLIPLLILGAILVLFVASLFDGKAVLATIFTVKLDILALTVLVHLITIVFLALRLKIIAAPHGKISLKKALRVTWMGLFVNFITPVAKIGGEPVKIYMLKKHIEGPKCWAIVTTDTFMEVLSSIIAFLLIFFVFFGIIPIVLLPYFIIFVLFTLGSILLFLKVSLTYKWVKRISDYFQRKLSKYMDVGEKDYAAIFNKAFRSLLKDKNTMFSALIVALGTKIMEFIRIWLIFLALGTVLEPGIVMVVWAFLLVLFLVPWLPGGLGLVEAGTAFAFIAFGIAAPVAASGVLLDRLITFWLVIFIGSLVASKFAIRVSDVRTKRFRYDYTKQ